MQKYRKIHGSVRVAMQKARKIHRSVRPAMQKARKIHGSVRLAMQKARKIRGSVRMAMQKYRKTCCSLRLDKHKGTGQLRVAPKSKMKGFKNPNENPTQTFDLEPLWKPSWGGVLYRLGKNVGRRINCSQKCGKTARWHQKLRTFGALALEGGAWGRQFLSLFAVCALISLL